MPKAKQMLETPMILDLRDRSDANVAAMSAFYKEHGYLCSPLLSAEECKDNVCELWHRVICASRCSTSTSSRCAGPTRHARRTRYTRVARSSVGKRLRG